MNRCANRFGLTLVQWLVAVLFLVTLMSGWLLPERSELWIKSLFWGFFWPLLTVSSLLLFGSMFCSICPLGTLGRTLSKRYGQRRLPRWLQHGAISLTVLVGGYWLVDAATVGFTRLPLIATLLAFSSLLLMCIGLSLYYRHAPFCRSICPFTIINQCFSHLSRLGLTANAQACQGCSTVQCSRACPKQLTVHKAYIEPISDCHLCLQCYSQCQQLTLAWLPRHKAKPQPSLQPQNKRGRGGFYVLAYLILAALVVVQSQLKHRWDNSVLHADLPWNRFAEWLNQLLTLPAWFQSASLVIMLFAIALTLCWMAAMAAFASRVNRQAPIQFMPAMVAVNTPMILCLLLSHGLLSFMVRGAPQLWRGFGQLTGLMLPEWSWNIARGAPALSLLGLILWAGIAWTSLLAWRWARQWSLPFWQRTVLFLCANGLVWLFLGLRLGGMLVAVQAESCH